MRVLVFIILKLCIEYQTAISYNLIIQVSNKTLKCILLKEEFIMEQEEIMFSSRHFQLSGLLYKPDNFQSDTEYPAIVIAHPTSSNKEQTSGLYAKKLAEKGFITFAFDAAYQGQSEGKPRYIEDPAQRTADISYAIDYLVTLPFVDEEKIGAMGICAGGGYAIRAAMIDHRIKAIAGVAAANVGMVYRETFGPDDNLIATLEAMGKQRTAEVKGADPQFIPWTPNTQEERIAAGITDIDIEEAVDYYRTPRGESVYSPNKTHFTNLAQVLAFDAVHLAEKLLTQPLQIIIGDKVGAFGSYRTGFEIFDRAASKEKDLKIIKGVSHYDLYDQPEATNQATTKLSEFFRKFL